MRYDHRDAKVSICVCSFWRPDQLDGLLAALLSQSVLGHVLEIVVVDNDPLGSARDVLNAWSCKATVPIVTLTCSEPNISLARNTAVQHASGLWIALIDDDETPIVTWLEHLLELADSHAADAVFGPVLPLYDETTPAWVIRGRFFERRRLLTGTRVTRNDVRSGNVLVRRDLLLGVPGPFDPAFGRTGGEDTLLFTRLLKQQARFFWCDEAIVHEPVEPARATLRWLLRRAYRGGQSFVLVALKTTKREHRIPLLAYLLTRAVLQLCTAGVLAVLCSPLHRVESVKWLRVACAQCGKVMGALGFHTQEYKH